MLIFNDGPPRAGKSYDAVKNHILPALTKGRAVYARLDGLDHAAIATYLKMPEARVRHLLHHISADDVVNTFRCRREGDKYIIPEHLRDALVLIDEVHEFYPAGMKPLEREQEQFFARHGQFGMDIVVASQTFDRMHSEIRARVERRVLFRKLSHFAGLSWAGLGGKNRYSRRFYVADGGSKFRVIGSDMDMYDPEIFPLYAGYQPGTTNTAVYEGGVKEAAGMGLRYYLPLAVIVGFVGLWFVMKFFDRDDSPLLAKARAGTPPPVVATAPRLAPQAAPAGAAQAAVPLPKIKEEPQHSPGVAFVLKLAKQHRPRAAGSWVDKNGRADGWVEFRSSQQHAADRLTLQDLTALGFTVETQSYGFVLRAEGETIIATYWPIDEWGRVSQRATERIRDAGGDAGPRASAATVAPGGDAGAPDNERLQAPYGAFRG